jgi:two-component system phosphate regulon sensor histidine kinase PhoR
LVIKLSTKLFLATALTACTAVLVATAALYLGAGANAESEAIARLTAVCEALKPGVVRLAADHGDRHEALQHDIKEAGDEIGVRITVILHDGRVAADSQRDPARLENHADRPEIQQARDAGKGIATRRSDSVQETMLYVALSAAWSDRSSAPDAVIFIRAALPTSAIDRQAAAAERTIVWGGMAGLLLSGALSWWSSRRLVVPIRGLAASVAGKAGGVPLHELADDSFNEVDALSRAIDTMRDDLRGKAANAQKLRDRDMAILASMRDGVIAVNRSQEIVHINRAALSLLRIPPGQAVGRLLHEVIRVPGILTAIQGAVDGDEVRSTDFTLHHAEGERTIELQGSTLLEPGGRTIGAVVVLRDVTELRRLESIRRDFVANVSHELKTPLTAIRSLTETLLEEDGPPPELKRRFLEKIATQGARLSALVTDLLSLSRLEQGEGPLQAENLDLGSYVAEAAKFLGAGAAAKGIQLSVEMPKLPVSIVGEEEGIRQLLNNLLDNAIKYTPNGGAVYIRCQAAETTVTLEVQDTGIGIAQKDQARIFERFYRVDRARSREMGGTGLGLSIVKHLAQAFGGVVRLDSEPRRGSIFRIQLPRGKNVT